MSKIDTTTEVVKALAKCCREEGTISYTQPGRAPIGRVFWSAEVKLLALADERDSLRAERDRLREALETLAWHPTHRGTAMGRRALEALGYPPEMNIKETDQ